MSEKIVIILKHTTLVVVWLLLWRLSVLMEYAPNASIWFPPTGLTFAAYLLLGWRAAPGIVLACVLSTFWEEALYEHGRNVWMLTQTGFAFAILHSLIYGGGAYLLRGSIERVNSYNLYQVVMRFLIVVAISSLCMAIAGIVFIYNTPSLTTFKDSLLAWWIGDMSGALVLTPLFIGLVNLIYPGFGLLSSLRFNPSTSSASQYGMKLFISISLLFVIMVTADALESEEIACFVFFLALPQMWIVYTETPYRTSLSLAIFSFSSASMVAWLGMDKHAYIYQFAINVIACSAYFAMAVPALVSDNKQLHEKVHIDYLTQAYSREHFFALVEQQIKYAQRYGQPTSLLLFDVDEFKQINDQFGHTKGDEVLSTLAKTMHDKLRESDILGRFGGDEFMLLLPNTPLENACDIAEVLRESTANLQFDDPRLQISCSFGVASVTSLGGLQAAFDEADKNLLQAKRKGRNQISFTAPGHAYSNLI